MDTSSALPEKRNQRKWSYLLLVAGCVLLVTAFLIGISDNPPGIALQLAGFFAVVLGIVYRFARSGKRKLAHQLLYWAPRALCIVIAVFISMFALDVFGEGKGFWETTLALLIHLIPTYFVLILLAVSWRWEWIGGIFFILLGIFYVVWAWNKPFGHWSTFLMIAGPPVLAGVLFLLNWYYRGELRGKS